MARFLVTVLAVAALCASSAVAQLSGGSGMAGEKNLRASRNLQEGFCNFIGCPGGFVPIPDAMNVECNSDPCDVSQCCEANCSFHACPDNFIPIVNANSTMCPDSGCTTDLCCDLFCSSFPCPGGYIPIMDAASTLCTDQECTTNQCCVDIFFGSSDSGDPVDTSMDFMF